MAYIGEYPLPAPKESVPSSQVQSGGLGIWYLEPFLFRYMVFFGHNLGIKYLVFSWILGILLGSVSSFSGN